MTDKSIKEILAATTKSDVSVPSEEFAEYIVEQAVSGRKLSDVVAATGEDLEAGEGDNVKVPYFPKVSLDTPGESGANDLSQTSYSNGETKVTLERAGKNLFFGAESIYHSPYNLVERALDAIAAGYADHKDEKILQALGIAQDYVNADVSSRTVEVETSVGDFTSTPSLFYTAIGDTHKGLKDIDLEADALVISPEAEHELLNLISDTNNNYQISAQEGSIDSVFGIDTIVSSMVTTYSAASTNSPVAALLPTDRAVAEARGMPEKYEEERDASKDGYEEVFNAYYGAGTIEDDSGNELFGVIYHS
jgi:hypothetical protein